MRCRRLLAVSVATYALVACSPSDQHIIGDHSVPINANYVGVAQGYSYLGGVDLGDGLQLWVIPYNSNYVRDNFAKGPFVIAIQARKYYSNTPLTFAPNASYLRLENGERVKPIGYRVVSTFASAHCHPIGAPGDVPGVSLRNNADPESFALKTASDCIEIFFNLPVIGPDVPFVWVMPKIEQGDRVIPARDISFIKHYGR